MTRYSVAAMMKVMIWTLVGENGFALQAALTEKIASFVAAHGEIAVERLDGETTDLLRIQASLQSAPFLAARKLVVLRNGSANKQFVEQVDRLLADLADTTDLLLIEPKVDKRTGYYKYLKAATHLQEFPELDEQGLVRWLVEAAKAEGGTLRVADAQLLVERVGANQQLLASELGKLLLYNPSITRQTIELLVEASPQSKVFDLLDAAFAGNTARALALYRDQREQKVDPSQIIAMLAWQLRILALLKTAGDRSSAVISRDAKLSPYTVQKNQGIARQLTLTQLKRLIRELLQLDLRSKRQHIDLDEALQNYLLALSA